MWTEKDNIEQFLMLSRTITLGTWGIQQVEWAVCVKIFSFYGTLYGGWKISDKFDYHASIQENKDGKC